MNLKIFSVLVFACVLFSSCGNYSESKGFKESLSGDFNESTGLDFKIVSQEIFSPKCTSCHIQYESYSGVARDLAAIKSAVESDRMPKNSLPLSPALKDLLSRWINAGAPNNVDSQDGNDQTGPVVLAPNWESLSENVFYPKCFACHNPNGQAKFLDLSTRQAFFEARDRDFGGVRLLDFEDPEGSYLIEVINDPFEPMPPVWSNIPALKPEEVSTIVDWIRKGLP